MINGIIVQNNPLKYVDPRGLNTDRFQSNQQSSSGGGGSFQDGDYFVDGGNAFYPDSNYNNQNVSLTPRNQEVPGIPDYLLPTADPVPTTTFLSPGNVKDQGQEHWLESEIGNIVNTTGNTITGTLLTEGITNNKAVKALKATGKPISVVSGGISIYEGAKAYSQRDFFGVAKAGLDIGMTALGVFGGPIGFGVMATYQTLDAVGVVDKGFEYLKNNWRNPVNLIRREINGTYDIGPPAY